MSETLIEAKNKLQEPNSLSGLFILNIYFFLSLDQQKMKIIYIYIYIYNLKLEPSKYAFCFE